MKENKHIFFDEDGKPVTSQVLEKTREFLKSAKNFETEKSDDDDDDEAFLTADERSAEEEDFFDTRQQDVSTENIQV